MLVSLLVAFVSLGLEGNGGSGGCREWDAGGSL
jgi:hypothetical protein